MEQHLILIEQYLRSTLAPEEKNLFEKRVTEDEDFAENVAFYLSTLQAAKEVEYDGKKEQLRRYYEQYKVHGERKEAPVRKLWPYVAAAAMIAGLILSWYLFIKPASILEMASTYITQNFTTLGVTMGIRENEMQQGLRLFNEGRLNEAAQQFEKLVTLDETDFEGQKYADITALRLQQYDKALDYFKLLEIQPGLYANPGAFYQAITLLKRNLPGDKQTAKGKLQQVVANELEGKQTAMQWLKEW